MFLFFKRKKNKKSEFEEIFSKINSLNSTTKSSFRNVKKDMGSVSKWIKYFKNNEIKQDNEIKKINKKIDFLISEIGDLRELYEEAPEPENNVRSNERSIVHERVQSFNRSNQSFMNVQSGLNVDLTPAQKKIISVLTVSKRPISYETIANELKLNIVTIRRHINDIKRIGFKIKEKMSVDTHRKVFYIEKEVKKHILSRK